MATKVGKLIKEARTGADLTQEKLARKVGGGLTAGDISLAERGEKDLTQAQLKKIAKACGVTQASLLEAAKPAARKAAAKKSTAKTAKPKTPGNANTTIKVTATEKKLIEAYRLATGDNKKAAMKLLKGESTSLLGGLLGDTDSAADTVADAIGDVLENLFK